MPNLLLLFPLFPKSNVMLGVAWTLSYEIAFYFLTAVLMLKAKSETSLIYRLHILTFVCIFWDALFIKSACYPFNLWPAFGMGVVVYHYLRDKQNSSTRLYCGLLFCTQMLLLVHHNGMHGHNITGQATILILMFTLLLASLHPYDKKLLQHRMVKGVAFIGTFSYSLYLVHLPITAASTGLLKRLLPGHYVVWMYVLGIPIALVSGCLFFLLVERHFLSAGAKKRIQAEIAPLSSSE